MGPRGPMVAEVKELPDDKVTSKYSPADEKVGAPTGSDPYWATVRAPPPVALAIVPSLVQVAVPDELDEERFATTEETAKPDYRLDPDHGSGGRGVDHVPTTELETEGSGARGCPVRSG